MEEVELQPDWSSCFSSFVAIVTGVGAGIGAAIAQSLLDAGATVVGVDRDVERLQSFEMRTRGRAILVEADATSETDMASVIDRCHRETGRLDGLVANSAMGIKGTVDSLPVASWNQVIEASLGSVFLAAHIGVPLMRASGGGSFVAIASQLGLVGDRENVAYCAAKGGVINLVRSMALDCASENIRVNCICPGPVDTPMLEHSFSVSGNVSMARQDTVRRVPLGRIAQPREIADVALFLLSPAASYVTGAAWVVDGGYTAT